MLTYTFRSQLPLGRIFCFFFFNDTATTEIYTLSLHDALPISSLYDGVMKELEKEAGIKPLQVWWTVTHTHSAPEIGPPRSEEHTSELQSRLHLVCRLLLEKKKNSRYIPREIRHGNITPHL